MIDIEKYIDEKGLFDGRYKLLHLLSSEGGTADIWLAEDRNTTIKIFDDEKGEAVEVPSSGIRVAIKIYRPKNLLDIEGEQFFIKEFQTAFDCHHENLLTPTGYGVVNGMPYLVIPFCKKGSTEKLIGKLTQKDDIWKFLYDVASGLNYLHTSNPPIIHQDIKPENILIDKKNNYCITDFGISVKTSSLINLYYEDESYGTIMYMPPERFEADYTPIPESDIWSLGATVYQLITGNAPFGSGGGDKQRKGSRIPRIKINIPKGIKKLLYACLNANPQKRPTAEYISEIARRKGNNRKWLLVLISMLAVIVIVSLLLVWRGMTQPSPESMDYYKILCNKGDSVIETVKSNEIQEGLITDTTISEKLQEAVRFYQSAFEKEDYDSIRKEDAIHKINEIESVLNELSIYKKICDSVSIAKEDNLDTQIPIFENKQSTMSNIIKEKIKNL